MNLASAISAILFFQAEPIAVRKLAVLLRASESDVQNALETLRSSLLEVGLCLMQNGDEVTIGTAPEMSELIEQIAKEELSKDISKAGLETLSIILYRGPITRSEIDFIRGVNSTFILRNLLIRGLVEKVENPKDQRSFLYKATFQLLEYLGVSRTEELPEYHDALAKLQSFENTHHDEKSDVAPTGDVVSSSSSTEGEEAGSAAVIADEMEDVAHAEEVEADIIEEDLAGANFDDEAMHVHTDEDRSQSTL